MTWKHIWIMEQSYIDMRTKERYPFGDNLSLKVWAARLFFRGDDCKLPIGKVRKRIEAAIEKHGYEFVRIDYDKEVRVIFAESE